MNYSDPVYLITWDQFLLDNNKNEYLQLLEVGDEVIIHGEKFNIIAPSNDEKNIWVRPQSGYLGDRVFNIETVIAGIDETLIIERRLKKLNIEDGTDGNF